MAFAPARPRLVSLLPGGNPTLDLTQRDTNSFPECSTCSSQGCETEPCTLTPR